MLARAERSLSNLVGACGSWRLVAAFGRGEEATGKAGLRSKRRMFQREDRRYCATIEIRYE
jgi:hypothetical protein